MDALYFLLLIGYVLLILAWLWCEKVQHRARIWVGLLAIISAAPFFVGLGGFFGTFSNNICYSEVVAAVADLPGTYARTRNTEALESMSSLASRLPLRGYETNCTELKQAVEALKYSTK